MKTKKLKRTVWLDIDNSPMWTESFTRLKWETAFDQAKTRSYGYGALLMDLSWNTVKGFLIRMDGCHLSQAELTVTGIGALLIGGGDQGCYAVLYYGDTPELQRDSLTLTDYGLSGSDVEITVNRDTAVLEARHAVRQPLMLEVAEQFYCFGVRKKDVNWEIGSSGQLYREVD